MPAPLPTTPAYAALREYLASINPSPEPTLALPANSLHAHGEFVFRLGVRDRFGRYSSDAEAAVAQLVTTDSPLPLLELSAPVELSVPRRKETVARSSAS